MSEWMHRNDCGGWKRAIDVRIELSSTLEILVNNGARETAELDLQQHKVAAGGKETVRYTADLPVGTNSG